MHGKKNIKSQFQIRCTVRTFNYSYTAGLGAPYGRKRLHEETDTKGVIEQGAEDNKDENEWAKNCNNLEMCKFCCSLNAISLIKGG